MPQLTCINPNEQAIDVSFESGETILQATYRAGVDGILAECGGGCSCATCHVILNANFPFRLAMVPSCSNLPRIFSKANRMRDFTVPNGIFVNSAISP